LRWLVLLALGVPGAFVAGVPGYPDAPAAFQPSDSMRVEIEVPRTVPAGAPVPVTLRITNTSARTIELHFQGRSTVFDLIVLRGDAVVWRRLEGATVPAILQLRMLAPGESVELSDTWSQQDRSGRKVGPGEYTVIGSIPTDQQPIKAGPAPLTIGQ
jgi:hypothetical protein